MIIFLAVVALVLLAVVCVAAVVTAFVVRGLPHELRALRAAVAANTRQGATTAEHAAAARDSAESAKISADLAGSFLRELRDHAASLVPNAKKSSPSFTSESR